MSEDDKDLSMKFMNSFLQFTKEKLEKLFSNNFNLNYENKHLKSVYLTEFPLLKTSKRIEFVPCDGYAIVTGSVALSELKFSVDCKVSKHSPLQTIKVIVNPLEVDFKLGVFPKENPDQPAYEFEFNKPNLPANALGGVQFLSCVHCKVTSWNGVQMEGFYLQRLAKMAMSISGVSGAIKELVEENMGPIVAEILYEHARLPAAVMGNQINNNIDNKDKQILD